jgi:murein DD-endopeptidase MepM/ murein hydrolase activator NlpD
MASRRRYRQAVRPDNPDTIRLRRWAIAALSLLGVVALLVVVASIAPRIGGTTVAPQDSPLELAAQATDRTIASPTPTEVATQSAAPSPPLGDASLPGTGGPGTGSTPDGLVTLMAAGTGSSGSMAEIPPPPVTRSLEPEELTGYQWPVRRARMTSFFEPRDEGFLVVDSQRIHSGLDLATFCGDRIYAAHGGTVIAASRRYLHAMAFKGPVDRAYERINRRGSLFLMAITVVIDDGNGYSSLYAHLSEVAVKRGDVVKAGDLIGYEGATGDATGCHLHYELIRLDGPWMRVAPDRVREYRYPGWLRERIDPLRVLSLRQRWHARFIPGINPPGVSPGLGRPTARNPSAR